jgi:hypothetical protein
MNSTFKVLLVLVLVISLDSAVCGARPAPVSARNPDTPSHSGLNFISNYLQLQVVANVILSVISPESAVSAPGLHPQP